MMDVTRIDHISMAVPELDPQVEFLERLFGFRFRGEFTQDGYVGAELEIPGRSGIGWEVLAPDGPDSYLHRFLDGTNGPGLHHLAMQVRDIDAAVASMRSLGIEPWGYDEHPGPEFHRSGATLDTDAASMSGGVAYLHPRGGGAGFLFQLFAGGPLHLPEPFVDEATDTLGITAVNSLAHAHHNRQELGDRYERLFGFQTVHRSAIEFDATSFSSRVLESPGGQFRIEVMQPTREDSFLQRFLDDRGPAVHHVSFEVGEMGRALRACERHGVRVLGERRGQSAEANWHEAFLAPEHTGGMLVQIFSWEPTW